MNWFVLNFMIRAMKILLSEKIDIKKHIHCEKYMNDDKVLEQFVS